jgi:hypothetical protein
VPEPSRGRGGPGDEDKGREPRRPSVDDVWKTLLKAADADPSAWAARVDALFHHLDAGDGSGEIDLGDLALRLSELGVRVGASQARAFENDLAGDPVRLADGDRSGHGVVGGGPAGVGDGIGGGGEDRYRRITRWEFDAALGMRRSRVAATVDAWQALLQVKYRDTSRLASLFSGRPAPVHRFGSRAAVVVRREFRPRTPTERRGKVP